MIINNDMLLHGPVYRLRRNGPGREGPGRVQVRSGKDLGRVPKRVWEGSMKVTIWSRKVTMEV